MQKVFRFYGISERLFFRLKFTFLNNNLNILNNGFQLPGIAGLGYAHIFSSQTTFVQNDGIYEYCY